MNKTIKRNVVISAILAIMLCVSLITGATFALFTSESKVNVAVSSGKVSVIANVDGEIELGSTLGANVAETTVEYSEDSNTVALANMIPGDYIQFDINVHNASTVTVQYRTIISCENDDGLFAGLNVKVGENENYSGVTLVSNWAELKVGSADEKVAVRIELPEGAGNEYQEKTCTISYKVEAVQGNAQVANPEDGTIYIYNANDMKALSGKYLVANNGKAEIQNVELMANVDLKGAEFKDIGVAYGDTLNFKGNGYSISNMKLATGRHNGMTNVGMFYVDSGATLNVENLKLVTPVVEDAIDAYATGAAAVVGYANGAVNLTNVDVENAKINNTFGNAAIYVGYGVNAINLTDCDIIGVDTTASGEIEDGAVRMDKTGAFVATANTASCVATLTNCTNESALNIAGRVINDATMTVDGAYYVTTAGAFTKALASGDNVKIILADGKYENVLTASGKTINVVGENEDGAEIALTNAVGSSHDHLGLGGCTVTLENVRATFEDGAYYAAYINGPTMTYKNCTIIGQQYIYGNTSFIDCVFDNDDDAAVSAMRYTYIYDGDVVVDNCDFYTQGHALIMYSDNGGSGDQTLTVRDSRFHGGQGRTAYAVANQNTAAIEIDSSCGANYTLILEGTNTFDGGFSGLWRIKAMKNTVTTIVNGVEYVGGSDTVYKDGVKYYKDENRNVYAYDGEYILVTTASELQSFLDANFTKIKFAADIEGDATVVQKEGVNVEINGDNYKFTGLLTVDGDGRQSGAETLLIENVNFVAEAGADSCIYSPDRNSRTPAKYSYSHNVTVQNCTFTDIDGVVNCAAIRHGDGGDKNWNVIECDVDSTMHSLLQINNVAGKLLVRDCEVNSKNGLNLGSCTNVEIIDNKFDTVGYCVRFGVNSGGNPNESKTFIFTNNTLTSACDDGDAIIIFRTSAANANTTVTMSGNTMTGDITYSGADNVNIVD